jgi:predicted MPP superfamily phosphohydrolase
VRHRERLVDPREARARSTGKSAGGVAGSSRGVCQRHAPRARCGGTDFRKRIVTLLNRFNPDVVFMTGDIYDGTAADVDRFAQPFSGFSASLGSYFVSGNHEEFVNRTQYLDALRRAGVRVLENEKVTVDGLQIVGVPYHDLATPERFQSALRRADLKPWRSQHPACPRAESAVGGGSGRRLFATERAHARRAVFPVDDGGVANLREIRLRIAKAGSDGGLHTCGAGTWGPPVRLGTNPEVVLIHFE